MDIGVILVYSWGYDQTNVEFFKVVKATSKTVTIEAINGQLAKDEEGFMCGHSVPSVPHALAPAYRQEEAGRKVLKTGGDGEEFVRMPYGIAKVWNGKPQYTSWYA